MQRLIKNIDAGARPRGCFGDSADFSTLKGKRILEIQGMISGSDVILFRVSRHGWYAMHHEQDCCETVAVEDVCGNPVDLLRDPILLAEEVTNRGETDWGTQTWTFYKLATVRGYVTIRWLGTSNGYYSEAVTFCRFQPGN